MKKSTAWLLACRPKTLPVSLSPVLLGTAIAWHEGGVLRGWPLLAAALAAALIQIGTNLFNDAGDFLRGTDTPERLGPQRASAQGWLTPEAVTIGAWLCFLLAFLCGIFLAWHGGWPIVLIGLASLAAGWSYTGGPKPIAYGPLGELFVLVFFGLVAVGGSYYLQTLDITPVALLASTLLGLHAAAVITVNNYRDQVGDARSCKMTLAVRLGPALTCHLYAAELFLPYGLLCGLLPMLGGLALLPWLTLPLALHLHRTFRRHPPSPIFNRILAASAGLQFLFTLLLSLAFVL